MWAFLGKRISALVAQFSSLFSVLRPFILPKRNASHNCKNCGKPNPQVLNEFGDFCDDLCFGTWQHKDKLRMMGH